MPLVITCSLISR